MGTARNVIVFLTLLLALKARSLILRLPCKDTAKFSVVKEDLVLENFVLETLHNIDEFTCHSRCLTHPLCKSVNREINEIGTCELNKKTSEDIKDNVTLTTRNGWQFISTNYNDTLVGENCEEANPCQEGVLCLDTCECPGYECVQCKGNAKGLHCNINYESTCNAYFQKGINKSGIFNIQTERLSQLKVYCDMELVNYNITDKTRGWLVIQRRVDASVNFDRNWATYKEGFGSKEGNMWIGLENLHKLAAPGLGAILRIEMKYRNLEEKKIAQYSLFEIGDEASGYQIKIGDYTGDADDELNRFSGMKFSTLDQDNDKSTSIQCAQRCKGGWWYRYCCASNPNGIYPANSNELEVGTGLGPRRFISWGDDRNHNGGLTFLEMKIRYQVSRRKPSV